MCSQIFQTFHTVSLRDFIAIGGSDVDGRLAVGNDAHISHYSVADKMPLAKLGDPDVYQIDGVNYTTRNDFVVCGALDFSSGAVMGGGNLVYVSPLSNVIQPYASAYLPGRIIQQSECPLDFDDIGGRMHELSEGLATFPRTATSVIEYTYVGSGRWPLASDGLNVDDLSLQDS